MLRGVRLARAAAIDAVERDAGAATALHRAGRAWASAGGTSGALWGAGLQAAADRIDDVSAPTDEALLGMVDAFAARVRTDGGAAPGEKTMVDAIVPFAARLVELVGAGAPLAEAWRGAAVAAGEAARDSANLVPRRGRARIHVERSAGAPDAGATSFALVTAAVGRGSAPSSGMQR